MNPAAITPPWKGQQLVSLIYHYIILIIHNYIRYEVTNGSVMTLTATHVHSVQTHKCKLHTSLKVV